MQISVIQELECLIGLINSKPELLVYNSNAIISLVTNIGKVVS